MHIFKYYYFTGYSNKCVTTSFLSLVNPGVGSVIAFMVCENLLNNVLFPTFGLPINEIVK